jgi:type IV secretion system protein VirD4
MRSDARDSHGAELVVALVLGTIAAIGGLLWGATGIAALVSGMGWPRLSAPQVASALAKLPAHLSNPRLAWAPAVRPRIAGPIAFYSALVVVLVMAAGFAVALVRLRVAQAIGGTADRNRRGATWGSGRDVAALRERRSAWPARGTRRGDADARLALGYRGRGLLRAEARHALVVFGPPQSGKSAGVAIPALLEWGGPAVACSVKTDLYSATVRRREALGGVTVFDPYGLSPARLNTWSPLRAARTWDGALSTALRLTTAGELDTGNVKGGSYWAAAAEQRLAPLLWTAANSSAGIEGVVRWAYGQGDAELPSILHRLLDRAADARRRADAQAAYDAHVAFEQLAGDTRSSIESTVQMLLRAYRSPRVQASARGCEITPERLLASSGTLYLIGDSHRSKLLRPIFLTLLQELVDHAYHEATIHGGRLPRPLLLCLDELGNVAPLPNLAEIASTAPSHNIQLVSIFHDIAQARARYGEQAHTAINSHRARMLLPGVADLETLRYFSDLLGEQRTRPHAREGKPSERLPLAAPEALRQLGDGEALLIYGRLAPTRLRLRTYYRDRRLRALAESPERPPEL